MIFKWNFLKNLLNKGSDYSKTAMIAWPVIYNDIYPPANPHITIFYFPDVTNNPEWKDQILDAIRATDWNVQPVVTVSNEVSMFGSDKNIPVLKVKSGYIQNYYEQLKAELDARNLPYDTTFGEYKPHVTITAAAAQAGNLPDVFILKPVALWWLGEQVSP